VERKRRVQVPGLGEVEGTELGFRPDVENWSAYLVDDGTVIRLKVVATEIVRLDGRYDPDGNPLYRVLSQNIMAVSAPDELRRQP